MASLTIIGGASSLTQLVSSMALPNLQSLITWVGLAALAQGTFAEVNMSSFTSNFFGKNLTMDEIDRRLFASPDARAEELGPVLKAGIEGATLDGQEAGYRLRYGIWLTKQGRPQDAIRELDIALEIADGDPNAEAPMYFHQGVAYLNLGELEQAFEHLHKSKSSYLDAAAYQLGQGNIPKANEHIVAAHKVIRIPEENPVGDVFDHGRIDLTWAGVNCQAQNFDTALEIAMRAEHQFVLGRAVSEIGYLAHSTMSHALVGGILMFKGESDAEALEVFNLALTRLRAIKDMVEPNMLTAIIDELDVDFAAMESFISGMVNGGLDALRRYREEHRIGESVEIILNYAHRE